MNPRTDNSLERVRAQGSPPDDSAVRQLAIYRAIFANGCDGIAILDADGRYLEQNAAQREMLGYADEDVIGRTPALHLGDAAFAIVAGELRARGRYRGEHASRSKQGETLQLELSAFSHHDAKGRAVGYVIASRDISDRRTALQELRVQYEQLQVVYRMTAALARARDTGRIFEEALNCLTGGLGADRAAILLFDADDVMRFKAWRGLSAEYRAAVEGHAPWRRDDADPQPVLVPDVRLAPELAPYAEIIRREGLSALGFIPLVEQGVLLGKFMIYYEQPHTFTMNELQLATTVAKQIAFALSRERADHELQVREQQYETLAEHAPDIITRVDRDLRYVYANRAIEEPMGVAREHIIGLHLEEIGLPDAVRDRWHARFTAALETGRPNEVEECFPTASGEVRHYQSRIVPEVGPDGLPETVLTITRDITERKREEDRQRVLAEVGGALSSSLDYGQTLQDLSTLLLGTMTDVCRIDVANGSGRLERAVLNARDPHSRMLIEQLDRIHPLTMDSNRMNVKAFRTGQPVFYPVVDDDLLRSRTIDDRHFELLRQLNIKSMMFVPLIARGRTLGVAGLISIDETRMYDQSDFVFVQELARRAATIIDNARLYEEVRDANAAKARFMATMSHELRTPLNAIMGYTQLLELGVSGEINERQQMQLDRIRSSTNHLLSVIEAILTFSRAESGREDTRLELIELTELIDDAVTMIEPAVRKKGLLFEVKRPARPTTITTDRRKARQILMNLLSNAVKFTERGSVQFETSLRNGSVEFSVADTGPGIAPELHDRVFEAFWQVDQRATRQAGGTGLGLTVTRQLVQILGGSIGLDSKPGRGSRFRVTLPIGPKANGSV